jgi:laccase
VQIRESEFTRLCHEKTILTVNGQFPGPTIYARRGDVVVVNVYNQGHTNITLHWYNLKDHPFLPHSKIKKMPTSRCHRK